MGVNGIYGLSGSGMDIESLVKVGMMSKQNEYDKMAQKYTKNEWMKSDYLDISSSLTTFKDSTLTQYKMSTGTNAKIAESSNSSIKVSAGSAATSGSRIVTVNSLSSNARLVSMSSGITRLNSAAPESADLKDVLFKNFTVDSVAGTVTYSTQTIGGEDRNNITNALSDTAFSFTLNNGKESKEISLTFEEISNGASLNTLASKIKNSGLNITASYDAGNDTFFISNSTSGEGNNIQISIGDNSQGAQGYIYSATNAARLFNSLKLTQVTNGLNDASPLTFKKNSSQTVEGTDGKITIDGKTYTMTDSKKTVDGVTYTALEAGVTSTVTVTQDTDAIIEKVKSFVADYNKLLSSLYEKYDEKSDSNYQPLTQSQKDGMKEDQITKWEEKAKKGLLYHDQTIGKIIQDMRKSITDGVVQEDGSTLSVFSIGISTTGIKGQLTLDEDKLKKALAENSDIVYNVLSKPDLEVKEKNGVAQKLGDILNDGLKSIKSRAGSMADITEDSDLNNLLRNLQTRMSNFKKMMSTFEDALYRKYDAMESALAKLGTQLNFIMGGNS